jgi:hypothetical protein
MNRTYMARGVEGLIGTLDARRIVEPKGTPEPAPRAVPARTVPPATTQRGGPVVLKGTPPVIIHVGGSNLDEPGRVRLFRFRISDEVQTDHPSMPREEGGRRKNTLAGQIGWVIRARNNDGDFAMGIQSSAQRISRVFSRVQPSGKVWLSPRIENKRDPLRTPASYVRYGLKVGGFIPFIKDDCLMPLLRGGAALGLQFEVMDVQDESKLPPINEIFKIASKFDPEEPSCTLAAERGFTFAIAASILKFQSLTEAIAAGPANLYNAYLGVITTDDRAHEAYHRILFEKFLRRKRLAPRAMNSTLDKELNRRANLLQAHRLFVFLPDGTPIALNRSLLEKYDLSLARANKLRADPTWGRWLIQEIFGLNYDEYMSRLVKLKSVRRQDYEDSTGSPDEQESVYEREQRDVDGLLAGYLTIV